MKRQVADRLFLTAISMSIVCIAYKEPESLSFTLMRIGGLPGQICMISLLLATILALFDVVVNDLMPDRFCFNIGVKYRQAVWAFIGVTYAGLAFVTAKYGAFLVAWIYLLYGARSIAMSFIDIYYDTRSRIEKRRVTDYAQLGEF